MPSKLYVNEFLEAETCPENQCAIVNRINGFIEIAFFDPIAHNKQLTDTQAEIFFWGRKMYPEHRRCKAPSVETCLLANKDEKALKFKSCATSTQELDLEGRVRGWTVLDKRGARNSGGALDIVENICPAILMSEEEFLLINPKITLENYSFLKMSSYDPFSF